MSDADKHAIPGSFSWCVSRFLDLIRNVCVDF